MKNFNTNTENKDEWLTPPKIIASLGAFDLDPCSPIKRPWDTATTHYTKDDDGLSLPWHGRVWLNPPYGFETFRWMAKLASNDGGGIALIFARTETVGFHAHVWSKAHAAMFFKGRIKFHYVDGTRGASANAPSCLISYGVADTDAIQAALDRGDLQGKLVIIK